MDMYMYEDVNEDDDNDNFTIVEKNGKYGYLDMQGNIIIPCNNDLGDFSLHEKLFNFIDGELYLSINGKHGLCSLTGQEIVPPIYDDVDFCGEGLYVVKMNNKYGCVNRTGKIMIPIIYDDLRHSSEGLVGVGKYTGKKINGTNEIQYGFVNRLGQLIIPCKYDDVGEFHSGLARVYNVVNGKNLYGFIDYSGILVSDIKYSPFNEYGDKTEYSDYYSDAESPYGLWVVEKGSKNWEDMEFGYMDRYGNDTFEE